MRKILIVIPTFNEKGNISIILKKINKFQKQASVLFVDDNSKDGSINEVNN